MAKFLSWFKGLFLKEKGKTIIDEIFAPIDPDKVAENLDVDFLARQSGEQEMPATNATTLDGNERKIVHVFEEDAQDTAQRANSKLQICRRSIDQLDMQSEEQTVESAKKRYESESAAMLQECRDNLKPYIAKRTELRAEFKAFQQENNLTKRGAKDSDTKLLFIAGLGIIFVSESVMNAFFFAAGSDFGLIGGWIKAMQYALVNLMVAFGVTLAFVRQVNHINRFRKAIGILGIVGLLVFVPVFNFFVGHFREIFAHSPEEAQTLAVQSFRANPFALATAESWLLLVVGVVFAAIAIYEGYHIEDPYPGYGPLDRRLQKASDEYIEEKEEIRIRLAGLKNSIVEKLDDVRDSVLEKQDELADLSSMADTIRTRFEMHLGLLKRCCNVVLSGYRQTNLGVRETPPPPHFHQNYEFSTSLSLNLPDTISLEESEDRKKRLGLLLKSIETQRRGVQKKYIEDLKNIDEIVQRLEFGVR